MSNNNNIFQKDKTQDRPLEDNNLNKSNKELIYNKNYNTSELKKKNNNNSINVLEVNYFSYIYQVRNNIY